MRSEAGCGSDPPSTGVDKKCSTSRASSLAVLSAQNRPNRPNRASQLRVRQCAFPVGQCPGPVCQPTRPMREPAGPQ